MGFSLSDAFSQIITNEGVGTLWNGTLPSLILVLNPAVQFMIYEAMKRKAGQGGRKVRIPNSFCIVAMRRRLLIHSGTSRLSVYSHASSSVTHLGTAVL